MTLAMLIDWNGAMVRNEHGLHDTIDSIKNLSGGHLCFGTLIRSSALEAPILEMDGTLLYTESVFQFHILCTCDFVFFEIFLVLQSPWKLECHNHELHCPRKSTPFLM